MQNRSNTFGEEVADQVGIFLSVVTGFIVAQSWNTAIRESCKKHKTDENKESYNWIFAMSATLASLFIMICWGYFVASRLYKPSESLNHARKSAHNGLSTTHVK